MLTVVTPLILDALVTANVTAVKLELVDTSPVSPQATTTPAKFESVNEDASHFTQQETKNGDDPVGSDDNKGEDRYDPLEITIAVLGKEVELVEYEMPFEFTTLEKAETPSD